MRSQDLLYFLRVHLRRVDAIVMIPSCIIILVQVIATYPRAVTFEVSVIVTTAQERAKERVKSSLRGHAFSAVKPQVPLANHVR